MSQDSDSHTGKSFPLEEPTFTADAWIAFKLQYEMLPGDGTATISRLRCDDPNVMKCFTTRRFDDRHVYHDSIAESDGDEYNFFGQPGRSRKDDSLRVWTNPFFSPSGSYNTGIDPGAWEGHKFRDPGTRAKFETTLGKDGKWKEDVPVKGWRRLYGELKVWVPNRSQDRTEKPTEGTEPPEETKPANGTNVPSILITEPQSESVVTGWGTISGNEKSRLQVPR